MFFVSVFLYFGSAILVPKPIYWQAILKIFYIEDNTHPFWLRNSRTGFFQAIRHFSQKVRRPFPFSCSRKKGEHQWARFLSKSQKALFWGRFQTFQTCRDIFWKSTLSLSVTLWDLVLWTDGKTNRDKFMEQCC